MFCYEPFSEAYASVIADVLGVKHIRYELDYAYKYPEVETTKHGIVSACEIYDIGEGNSRLSLWDYICEVCNERVLNPRMITTDDAFSITLELDRSVVNKIFDVLYFDAIICNVDRHMRNIELIRDAGRNIVNAVPVFDCGSSYCILILMTGKMMHVVLLSILIVSKSSRLLIVGMLTT
jgi:hipA-like C-terminal domain